MRQLEFAVQCHVPPALSLAADEHLLRAVVAPTSSHLGALRVYDFEGRIVSLGRYQRVGDAVPTTSVRRHRRLTGGRAIPFGEGFVGLALVLPHRSALVSADPSALTPEQVMNRCVRGIMHGFKTAGIDLFYPGRDLLTVRQRRAAMVCFEVDANGALLFEAVIANTADFGALPYLLDEVDPGGAVTAEMLTPEQTTCVSHEIGATLTLDDVAELLRRGYEQYFGLECIQQTDTAWMSGAALNATASAFAVERCLYQRGPHAHLPMHAQSRTQLGSFEAWFSLTQDNRIDAIVCSGDFIANSPAIEALQTALVGCPAAWAAIDAVVSELLAQPGNFILGIGPSRTVADTICKGING